MNLDRAYRVQTDAKSATYSAFSAAVIYKSTSEQLNKTWSKIVEALPKGTPRHITSFLQGMREVLVSDLYKDHLEFCYTVNGVMYSIDKKSERYYEKHNITPRQLAQDYEVSGHYWKDSDKPYFSNSKPK